MNLLNITLISWYVFGISSKIFCSFEFFSQSFTQNSPFESNFNKVSYSALLALLYSALLCSTLGQSTLNAAELYFLLQKQAVLTFPLNLFQHVVPRESLVCTDVKITPKTPNLWTRVAGSPTRLYRLVCKCLQVIVFPPDFLIEQILVLSATDMVLKGRVVR